MIYVMAGISASGKTTIAKRISKNYDLPLISTDDIREELFGDANCQENGDLVFKIAYERLEEAAKGRGAVFDATNLTPKARKEVLSHCKEHKGFKICLFSICLVDVAIERNGKRERQVPIDVIRKQYKKYTYLTFAEGWDRIDSFK